MGIHQYGANDVRRALTIDDVDGDLNNFVEFSDYQHKDGETVMKLGTTRQKWKIRAYNSAERSYFTWR